MELYLRRLASQLVPDGDCLIWTGPRNNKGYGKASGKIVSRLLCEYYHGPSPFKGAQAIHSCDNKPCGKREHLSWGTQSRNVKERRDRLNNHATQKLTLDQARAIRKDGRTCKVIAAEYGVCAMTISRIRSGKGWIEL